MIFGVTARKLISHDDAASQGSLWKCFDACTRGLLSFPLCVPGTAFYQCMQVNQLIKHAAMSRELSTNLPAWPSSTREIN